jgi:CheY-like chemotaxis protein
MPLPFNPQQEIAEKRLLMTQAIAQNKARLALENASAITPAQTRRRPLRMMLVEDVLVNQVLFKKILEKEGHQVVIAQNGLEAVELFPSAHWDMILMDVLMPTMSGLQATVLIRFIEETEIYRVPIVGVSANSSTLDRQACTAAGMDDFLPKPINIPDLRAMIDRFCTADMEPTLPAGLTETA